MLSADPILGIDNFGAEDNWNSQETLPRFMADVNGDGQEDIVGFGANSTLVSISNGDASFAEPQSWVDDFSVGQGWASQNSHPRFVEDVNGDGKADIVGIEPRGIFVSVSLGATFSKAELWSDQYGRIGSWPNQSESPRMIADVNGDGMQDIVGFGTNGVDVSLSTGDVFTKPARWVNNYGAADGWDSLDHFPRMLADVNGDQKYDIVGFGARGVFVSLAQAGSFSEPDLWVGDFGERQNWISQDASPRVLADMNGDGLNDVVGFGSSGSLVSLSSGDSFASPVRWADDFGGQQGWASLDSNYRAIEDVNGDGKSDIVAFSPEGTWIAESTGTGLKAPELWISNFDLARGWDSQDTFPRVLADVNGDGQQDIVGFGETGVLVFTGQCAPQLSSDPDAPITVYLDFDGNPAGTLKGQRLDRGGRAAVTPRFNMADSNYGVFDGAERAAIEEVFERVAEDYAPFVVNVTTIDPGQAAFDAGTAVRVAIGGHSSDWYTPGQFNSGASWTSTIDEGSEAGTRMHFTNAAHNRIVWVWSEGLERGGTDRDGAPWNFVAIVANTAAHESGHTMGLQHHNIFDEEGQLIGSYSRGNAAFTPIMGTNLNSDRTIWHRGPVDWNSENGVVRFEQDDLEELTSGDNGFGYRPDDHGESYGQATPIFDDNNQAHVPGLIEQMSDEDWFSFTTYGGELTVRANVAGNGVGNLHAEVSLYRIPTINGVAGPAVLIEDSDLDGIDNPPTARNTDWGAGIEREIPAGSYAIAVRSFGGYGDIGTYTLDASIENNKKFMPGENPLLAVESFGARDNWSSQDEFPRYMADVTGDGREDIVGFGVNGTFVSVAHGDSFTETERWVSGFGTAHGWTSQNAYPRYMADVNGDNRKDIVGFGNNGVVASVSLGNAFSKPVLWSDDFAQSKNWTSQSELPRMLADVNGDDLADVVGFGVNGTYVSLSDGASFAASTRWIQGFGTAQGWINQEAFPRVMADVNNDGSDDIVGFGARGAFVSLSKGDQFEPLVLGVNSFGSQQGWTSQDKFPRFIGDVNGDDRPDIVGFGAGGTHVSIANGIASFEQPTKWIEDFGTDQGWTSQNEFPRVLADVNGDGRQDIVGFQADGTYVSESTYTSTVGSADRDYYLRQPELWVDNYGTDVGWTSQDAFPRFLSDFTGDGSQDLIGFGSQGAYIYAAESVPQLSSLPDADVTLHLDFDGNPPGLLKGQRANRGGRPSLASRFTLNDTNEVVFDAVERDAMRQIFDRVAEDFAPFNVNVTTVDPGQDAYDQGSALRAAIGGNSQDWYFTDNPTGTGRSNTSTFQEGPDVGRRMHFTHENHLRVVWVFPESIESHRVGDPDQDGQPRQLIPTIANTTSHELGHALGLQHQDDQSDSSVARGNAAFTPIMGDNGTSDRTIWDHNTIDVELENSDVLRFVQDDLAELTNGDNGFGYREDDHGGSFPSARPILPASGQVEVSGIIEQMTDEDWFSFTTDGGTIQLRAEVPANGVGNLHAEISLYRIPMINGVAGPAVLIEDSDLDGLDNPPTARNTDWGASIEREISAGTYVVAVRSFGGYGDIGSYTLTGTIGRMIGDSNGDGVFNSSDLVTIFAAGEYQDGIQGNSTFEEGDWNLDGDFDSSDLVLAFQLGNYTAGARPPATDHAAVIDSLFAQDDEAQRARPSDASLKLNFLELEPIASIRPNVDRKGLLRVGGREF